MDNSQDEIYSDLPDDEDDPHDLTFSPSSMEDSLKSSETWSEQSLETPYVSLNLYVEKSKSSMKNSKNAFLQSTKYKFEQY